MALPRKGLRKISVGGITYGWMIRRKPTRIQSDYDGGCMTVAIEQADDNAKKLIVKTARPHPKNASTLTPAAITPTDVRHWIQQSIKLGWNSSQYLRAVVREYDSGALVLSRA